MDHLCRFQAYAVLYLTFLFGSFVKTCSKKTSNLRQMIGVSQVLLAFHHTHDLTLQTLIEELRSSGLFTCPIPLLFSGCTASTWPTNASSDSSGVFVDVVRCLEKEFLLRFRQEFLSPVDRRLQKLLNMPIQRCLQRLCGLPAKNEFVMQGLVQLCERLELFSVNMIPTLVLKCMRAMMYLNMILPLQV